MVRSWMECEVCGGDCEIYNNGVKWTITCPFCEKHKNEQERDGEKK
jgi:hypothetical protein